VKLGVYLGWHTHPWEELLALVLRAEELGYAAAFADGDVSMLDRRSEVDCLDGWTVTTALLARTSRIQIGSLRLVHHWNAARLAQAAATAERLAPGRLRFQISIGDRAADEAFGLPLGSTRERIDRLDQTLEALQALWRGEAVTRHGRHLRLDAARVRPTPPGGRLPITVAARRRRMLELVAAHADVWEVNLPPIRDRVARAAQGLAEACERRGRDPSRIERSMLLFTRIEGDPKRSLAEFRRLNPWFRSIPDAEVTPALLLGDAPGCLARIREVSAELQLALPVLDLSGLEAGATRRLLEALAPANNRVDAST
jgi:alkanesulfonate monooxygenase SsuD/methylene tetrahydromethanopterin reductase-like flavin-dependent oxidoreductase (luciferase family)